MEILEVEQPQIGERRDISLSTEIRQSKKDPNVFTFIISKEEEDRHESLVKVAGIDTTHYRNNPIVLFNHDYDKVIGRAFNVRVVGDTMQADMSFADTDLAQEVKGLVSGGFLNATSIGFLIKSWTMNEDSDTFEIIESELLEFSIVSVPSNRSSLIMRNAQIDTLTNTITKLSATVERLAQRIEKSEEAVEAESVNTADQEDQRTDEVVSTPEADEQTAEAETVPEEDQAINEVVETEQPAEVVENSAESTTMISIAEAVRIARSEARRALGKE